MVVADPTSRFLADIQGQWRTAVDYSHDINPTLKDVPGRPPMFIFAGESRECASLIRRCSSLVAPTVAKTVATNAPCLWDTWTYFRPRAQTSMEVPIYKEGLMDTLESGSHKHRLDW